MRDGFRAAQLAHDAEEEPVLDNECAWCTRHIGDDEALVNGMCPECAEIAQGMYDDDVDRRIDEWLEDR